MAIESVSDTQKESIASDGWGGVSMTDSGAWTEGISGDFGIAFVEVGNDELPLAREGIEHVLGHQRGGIEVGAEVFGPKRFS